MQAPRAWYYFGRILFKIWCERNFKSLDKWIVTEGMHPVFESLMFTIHDTDPSD